LFFVGDVSEPDTKILEDKVGGSVRKPSPQRVDLGCQWLGVFGFKIHFKKWLKHTDCVLFCSIIH
jgi:hypothetical protein